jgi:hypothetical protein
MATLVLLAPWVGCRECEARGEYLEVGPSTWDPPATVMVTCDRCAGYGRLSLWDVWHWVKEVGSPGGASTLQESPSSHHCVKPLNE